jgi:7-cyano-7-deazaguanine synthase in queuosine biosynthesis
MSRPYINVLCDLARRKKYKDAFEIDKAALLLSCDERQGNVYLRLREVEAWLGNTLSPISRDLIEVAAYIYQADKGVRRGAGDRWTRHFSMLIPVRLPSLWQSVSPQLVRMLFSLIGDQFDCYFVPREPDMNQTSEAAPAQTAISAADCVCLFSGGADSFAGATALLRLGRNPALASHYISNRQLQQEQSRALSETFGREIAHLQFRVAPQNIAQTTKIPFKTVENTQRSRSFLYLSVAAVVASERHLNELFICENGVLAINLPLTPSRFGSRSTHSAHPQFLESFEKVIGSLFKESITIRNPFLFKTKKEVIEVVTEEPLKKELRKTISCWGFPRRTIGLNWTKHCGYCLPCIHRRIAFIAAGYERWDDKYKVDIFKEYNSASDVDNTDFRDLLRFAINLSRMSADELIFSHPGLLVETGRLCDTDSKFGPSLLAQMLLRFSSEVLEVAKRKARRALKEWQIMAEPAETSNLDVRD